MKEQKKKRHIEGMDALRGFAILGVVLYHVMPEVVSSESICF